VSQRKRNSQDAQPTRRDFARTLAVLAATPLVGGAATGLAQDQPKEQPKPADPAAEITKALGEIARIRYGKFLNADQLKKVQRSIGFGIRSGERLGKIKLKNSDEPAFLFWADVP
jgi:hypothetical protein